MSNNAKLQDAGAVPDKDGGENEIKLRTLNNKELYQHGLRRVKPINMRLLRRALGLTMESLAEQADITYATLIRYEDRLRLISRARGSTVCQLAAVFRRHGLYVLAEDLLEDEKTGHIDHRYVSCELLPYTDAEIDEWRTADRFFPLGQVFVTFAVQEWTRRDFSFCCFLGEALELHQRLCVSMGLAIEEQRVLGTTHRYKGTNIRVLSEWDYSCTLIVIDTRRGGRL